MAITVQPLTPERWPDLEALFQARGCGVARSCWCMFYRRRGQGEPPAPGERRADLYRRQLRALAERGDPPPGLIGYEGDTPVGWVSLGPRPDFARLARSPVMKPVDTAPVWSIVCFVVPPVHGGRGVAKGLLAAAVDWAAQRGVTLLEAYPVDRAVDPDADELWFGTQAMFDAAGFTEVARRRPARPVMRLAIAAPAAEATPSSIPPAAPRRRPRRGDRPT